MPKEGQKLGASKDEEEKAGTPATPNKAHAPSLKGAPTKFEAPEQDEGDPSRDPSLAKTPAKGKPIVDDTGKVKKVTTSDMVEIFTSAIEAQQKSVEMFHPDPNAKSYMDQVFDGFRNPTVLSFLAYCVNMINDGREEELKALLASTGWKGEGGLVH